MLGRCLVICVLCEIFNAEISISKLKEIPEKFNFRNRAGLAALVIMWSGFCGFVGTWVIGVFIKDVEGCYIEELDTVVPFEESRPSSSECLEYRCERNWIYHASCGLAIAMPPVELVEDMEKPYPDCCPRLKDQ